MTENATATIIKSSTNALGFGCETMYKTTSGHYGTNFGNAVENNVPTYSEIVSADKDF